MEKKTKNYETAVNNLLQRYFIAEPKRIKRKPKYSFNSEEGFAEFVKFYDKTVRKLKETV